MTMCEKCGHELQVGDFPFCSRDGNHRPGRFNVQADEIPGGLRIEHGLVNLDGSPRTFYSKSEIARAAREAGLVNMVRHQGSEHGSDKSPFTTRWV